MANFCLPKEFASKFLTALKDGTIDPAKLIDMTSGERREFFTKIVGEDDAKEVNALLESKLLLKDQKTGMVAWAKKVSGISEATRTDIVSKIERMTNVLSASSEDAFLADLAAKKLGTDVSFDDAQRIVDGTKAIAEAQAKIKPETPAGSDDRLDYGLRYVEFQKFIGDLKNANADTSFKTWITSPSKIVDSLFGTTKSILSSFDNSYFGRQGIKTLFTNPDIWAKNFAKSWGDIAKEILPHKVSAIDAIKADIYSRPNALNGKYSAMGLDIGIDSEESFPSSLPEKIPLLGRLYKASEAAYNGAALRMRADLADRLIPRAEAFGVDLTQREQARGIGTMINAITGRGNIGKLNVFGKEINAVFFSIKFLKANYDTLTMHNLGYGIEEGPARNFVRVESAKNILKITTAVAGIMYIANTLYPGSVDFDPRSSNFGKIKIGDHTIDITGGMASLATLASRAVPTKHGDKGGLFGNGISFWSKSATTGKYMDLTANKFGQQNVLDVVNDFIDGKVSPVLGVLHDVWTGRDYNGQKPTLANEAESLVTPIPLQDFEQLKDPNNANTLALSILDSIGFSTQTTPPKKK